MNSASSSKANRENLEYEEFTLNEKKSLLDMLIVADTSGSMYHHLNDLGRSLSDLLHVISDYDWQIAITSADHGDHENYHQAQQKWKHHISQNSEGKFGSLMSLENGRQILPTRILNPEVRVYEDVFLHSLSHFESFPETCHRPPYCQGLLEQPLRSLKSAIERSSLDNNNLFRPQADFVSLIISNEEERAEDRQRATTADEVVQAFNIQFAELDKKFIAINIIVMDDNCLRLEKAQSKTSHTARIAHSIGRLAELTGGYNASICSSDYSSVLRKLSRHIKNSLENSILLKKHPIPSSVNVQFYGGYQSDWKLYGKNIIFTNRFSGPVSVSVSYKAQE